MKKERSLTIDALPVILSGGISNYVGPLTAAILRLAADCLWHINLFFRLASSWKRYRNYWRYRDALVMSRVSCSYLPDRLIDSFWRRGLALPRRSDVFLATTEMVPSIPRARLCLVGWVVYDLSPLRLPQFFSNSSVGQLAHWLELASRTDFVVAISETTKRDVMELLKYPEERVVVLYPGAPRVPFTANEKPRITQKPYVIYIGSLALNKNVDGLIRIFARCIHDHGFDWDLIIVGKDFCGSDFWQAIIDEARVGGRVYMAGRVSDREREVLLAGACMLWQFSWYEGFGLPILEAAAKGIPVFYGNRGAVKEIIQNPEQEIDPGDPCAAAEKIAVAYRTPGLFERWRKNGLDRASFFSWDKSASQLFDYLSKICS